jgi:Septum formation
VNTRTRGLLTAPVLALALAAALTGCSALDSALGGTEEAQRDEPGGEITEAAEADAFSLQVGDCIDYAALSEATEFDSVRTVPCADPHDAEIYAETTLTEEQFQADLALREAADTETPSVAETFCYDAFAGFVGTSYEESTLDFVPFTPTEESWEQGDDVVQCLVTHPEGGFTGSMQNSAL